VIILVDVEPAILLRRLFFCSTKYQNIHMQAMQSENTGETVVCKYSQTKAPSICNWYFIRILKFS
jgi:hypothetical protein